MYRLKKVLSLFLIILIITVSFSSSLGLQSFAVQITTMYIEPTTSVNIRSGPGTEYPAITTVGYSTATIVDINPTTDKNGKYQWYHIIHSNGTDGWIAYDASYIRIVTYNPDSTFEEQLNAFPTSYRDPLRVLKAAYPNWTFIPDPVNINFWDAVALESTDMRKQVSLSSQPVSWRSMGSGCYDWNTNTWFTRNGGWTGASREIVAFYMDPRNFLNTTDIYQFLQQGYDAINQTEDGVAKIISGTFMEVNYNDPNDAEYGGSYAKVIMAAAEAAQISPYILAAKIRHEIGTGQKNPDGSYTQPTMVSGTVAGYENYYNFFNIGASGANNEEVITNGLKRAVNEGWTTRSHAIKDGALFLSNNYIAKGQDTYFYQDFNVHHPDQLWHQYAEAVHDAVSKAKALSKSYIEQNTFPLVFKIPIFPNMPENAAAKPVSSESCNNYYFSNVSVSGLTPSFSMYTNQYNLQITGDTAISVTPVKDAVYVGETSFSVKVGSNAIPLTVKAQTGYVTDYYIYVESTVDCTVTVTANESSNQVPDTPPDDSSSEVSVMAGDTNGDGKISLSDLANLRLHLLGKFVLEGNNSIGADTNKDGKISLSDLANIRLHLLGLYTIS